MTNPITDLKARIRAVIAQGITPGALAKRAGLHRNSLYGCSDPAWNPKAATLEQVFPSLLELEKEGENQNG